MPTTTVTLNASKWEAALKQIGKAAPKACARALNRAVISTRTVMARAVAKDLDIKVSDVTHPKVMTIYKATAERPVAQLAVEGARIPLYDFRAKQTKRGVTAKVEGQRKVYPGTFIATMKSGHTGVFGRRGKTRRPIDERFVVSVPHVFAKYAEAGQQAGMDSMIKNLEHEIGFELDKLAV